MNIKTLKVLRKWAHMQIPGPVYERVVIEQFELLNEKEKKQTLKEIKMQILLHNN
jgi:hypothetical protein